MKFYYVYILFSRRDSGFYAGYTINLPRRLRQHCSQQVPATASRLPMVLIFYEAYLNKYDALRREKYLKTNKGKTTLKTMLREFLRDQIPAIFH